VNPNSKFQSLTTQFLSAKGEHRAISANQIAIFLPSLPPVAVGLRVAQRPLQIRCGVGWNWLQLRPGRAHVTISARGAVPPGSHKKGWGRWRPGVSCSDTCVSLVSHKCQNLRDTYLLGEIPSRYLLSPLSYFGPDRLMRQPPPVTDAGWLAGRLTGWITESHPFILLQITEICIYGWRDLFSHQCTIHRMIFLCGWTSTELHTQGPPLVSYPANVAAIASLALLPWVSQNYILYHGEMLRIQA
jgi:hypothetical protein